MTKGQFNSCSSGVLRCSLLITLFISIACQSARKPAALTPRQTSKSAVRTEKPLIDFARGAGGLPMAASQIPQTIDALARSLEAGYAERVRWSDYVRHVQIIGESVRALDLLKIDISGSAIRPGYKPTQFKQVATSTADAMHVKRLEYIAAPLHYEHSSSNLRVWADDVALVIATEAGKSALLMTDARNGRIEFDANLDDLRNSLRIATRANGSRGGFRISGTELNLWSPDPRSLCGELRVRGWWLLLPCSFRFTGQINVDEQSNAHLSGVGCVGEDVGGVLLAGFIDAALRQQNGRVFPVARFAGDRVKVRNVEFHVDGALHFSADFGSAR